MAAAAPTQARPAAAKVASHSRRRRLRTNLLVTLLAAAVLALYLMPLAYGISTSLKSKSQSTDPASSILPAEPAIFEYEGERYELYQVPFEGEMRELALVQRGREASSFLDPQNPEAGLVEWEGRWRTLDAVREIAPQWQNYADAFRTIDFLELLRNTLYYAGVSTLGAVASAALVGYGFARFHFPFRNVLFVLVIATIILPPQVTLVPKYAFFLQIGWVGTWLPLIVPQYFANGYNIFLMRQYFLTIPRAMDEAAMIDGAGPPRIFWSVILPQAKAALLAVALFHFFFAWNDFFEPLIYLAGIDYRYPLTVGLRYFNGVYSSEPQLIQAASVMTLIIPLLIFFLAQRYFIQGVVITGVEK